MVARVVDILFCTFTKMLPTTCNATRCHNQEDHKRIYKNLQILENFKITSPRYTTAEAHFCLYNFCVLNQNSQFYYCNNFFCIIFFKNLVSITQRVVSHSEQNNKWLRENANDTVFQVIIKN